MPGGVRYQRLEAATVKMAQSQKFAQSAYQRRLLSASTTLSVTLGERKLSMGSLLDLVPGTILPMEISCDRPLRLSIGPQTIGTVEAVKLGDRFGVRIRDMRPPTPG